MNQLARAQAAHRQSLYSLAGLICRARLASCDEDAAADLLLEAGFHEETEAHTALLNRADQVHPTEGHDAPGMGTYLRTALSMCERANGGEAAAEYIVLALDILGEPVKGDKLSPFLQAIVGGAKSEERSRVSFDKGKDAVVRLEPQSRIEQLDNPQDDPAVFNKIASEVWELNQPTNEVHHDGELREYSRGQADLLYSLFDVPIMATARALRIAEDLSDFVGAVHDLWQNSEAVYIGYDEDMMLDRIFVKAGTKATLPYTTRVTPDDFPGFYSVNRDLPDELCGEMTAKFVAVTQDEDGSLLSAKVELWLVEHENEDEPAWYGIELQDHDQAHLFATMVTDWA